MPRKSPYEIALSVSERTVLEATTRRYTLPYYQVIRAKMILLAAEGLGNDEIAEKLDLPRQIVSKWRKRFHEQRLAGLEEQQRSGRPPDFSPSASSASQGGRL